MSQSSPSNLLDLPAEVLVHILEFLHPVWDILTISKTCRHLHRVCQNSALKLRRIEHRDMTLLCDPGVLESAIHPETKELTVSLADRTASVAAFLGGTVSGGTLSLTLLSKISAATPMLTKLTLEKCYLEQDAWMFLPETLEELHMPETSYSGRYDRLFSNSKKKVTNLKVFSVKTQQCLSEDLILRILDVFRLRKIFQVDAFKSEESVFCRRIDLRAASDQECDDLARTMIRSEWVPDVIGKGSRGRIERVSEEEYKIELRMEAHRSLVSHASSSSSHKFDSGMAKANCRWYAYE